MLIPGEISSQEKQQASPVLLPGMSVGVTHIAINKNHFNVTLTDPTTRQELWVASIAFERDQEPSVAKMIVQRLRLRGLAP